MSNFNDLSVYLKVNYIFLCIQFAISILGLAVNTIVIWIFLRKSLRRYSYSFYCLIKAFCDIIMLIYGIINWSGFVPGANLSLVSPFFCFLNQFVPYECGFSGTCLILVMTLDRVLMIIYPKRFKFIRKKWFQILIVLFVAFYSLGINIVLPLNTKFVISQTSKNQTIVTCTILPSIASIQSWIRNVHIIVLLFVFNNVLNIKLIKYVILSRRRVSIRMKSYSRAWVKERRMGVSAIGIGIVAMFCKLPLGIVTIITYNYNLPFDQMIMMTYIAITLICIENSASFFINMFFNTIFYNEFMIVFLSSRRQIIKPNS